MNFIKKILTPFLLVALIFCTGFETVEQSLEAEIASLINIERSEAGLAPYQSDPFLTHLAQKRGTEYSISQLFRQNHYDFRGFVLRNGCGYRYVRVGECLSYGNCLGAAHFYVDGLMASPGHRQIMLSSNRDTIGIAISKQGKYYITVYLVGKQR